MDWIKEHIFEILSCFIAACGAIATVVATQIADSRDFFAVFVVILVVESVSTFIWILALKNRFDYERKINALELELEKEKLEGEDLRKKHDALIEKQTCDLAAREEVLQQKMRKLFLDMKNVSKLNNELCYRIPGLSESSYRLLANLEGLPEIPDEKKKEAIIESRKEFSVGLFNLYKQYTSNLLGYTLDMVERYLEIFDKPRDVSVTVKMLNKPYFTRNDARKDIIVYTAFRDKRTYEAKEREIGTEPYSIDGNIDFLLCIRQEEYLINNAKKGDSSYANEHKDFDAYYNCAAVVPIRAKQDDGTFKMLGYLCCDCLNSDLGKDVFDKLIASMLFALAQQYATFLETLESNWADRFNDGDNDEPESILSLIFDRIYIGKK